jgi:thermitase
MPRFRSIGWFFFTLSSLFAAGIPDHVPGRLLVANRPGADQPALARTLALHCATLRLRLDSAAVTVLDIPEDSSAAIRDSLLRSGLFDSVDFDYYARTAAVPNDPSYGAQWHLPRIQTPQAWNLTTGAVSIPVAVLDSGVDPHHPDLSTKLVPGWNFVHAGSNTADVLGHGTAVAGTIAAAANNGIGGAGVSWASPVMPLVVVDEFDFAAYSTIAAAIVYAADHGVRVINISIGGPNPSTVLQNAVDYAWSKGAILVASAMNNTSSDHYYPAACNHVIAVSATDSNDHLAGFSNFGNWITIAAPGTNILTTGNGGGYGYWYGTSFSAPIVAGVAALCLSVNPDLTNAEVVAILTQSADNIGTPGIDSLFGAGRVNAYSAVLAAQQILFAPRGRPRPTVPATTSTATGRPAAHTRLEWHW